MKALLLIAHGSRAQSSNDEIRALVARLREDARGERFDLVEHAFLEMAEPSIAAAADKLVADGATEIVVLPYFLAAGKHLLADIPSEVARLERRHSATIRFIVAPHLGAAAGMQDLIYDHLQPL